jgi:hypothetical protein
MIAGLWRDPRRDVRVGAVEFLPHDQQHFAIQRAPQGFRVRHRFHGLNKNDTSTIERLLGIRAVCHSKR